MQCERCEVSIPEGEKREHNGQVLCEDCYIDLLSPAKACDPWAVHSAKTFMEKSNSAVELSPVQQKILEIIRDEGPQEPGALCNRLQIKQTDLERDIATLRHMEKIRGELRGGKRFIRLW